MDWKEIFIAPELTAYTALTWRFYQSLHLWGLTNFAWPGVVAILKYETFKVYRKLFMVYIIRKIAQVLKNKFVL